MLPQGPATRIIVSEFWLSWPVFVRFWQYFGQFLPLLGPFLGPLGPFWSLFDPLSLVVSSPWWQALEFEAFLAIFPIFLGFVRISWGTPAICFTDFGSILAIFDHFCAIFGPFLGRNFLAFFADFWHFGPGIRARGRVAA